MSTVLGLLTLAAMMLFTLGTGQAVAGHVQCGDVITQDTTLDSDLTCSGDGLTVTGNGVAVDLAGHTIEGAGSATGILDLADDTEVLGGTIRGFGTGVGADGPAGLLVHHVLIHDNGAGVACAYAPACSVTDSTLRDNGIGIRMSAPDGGSFLRTFVRRNHVHHNGAGVSLIEYLATVTDNRIEDNSGRGVDMDNTARVAMSRNVVAGNREDGVVVRFLSSATISSNRIERNGGNGVAVIGDLFFGNTSAVVQGNRIMRNGGDGVLVEAEGAHAVVERNRTDRNGDDGIDVNAAATAPAEAIDTLVRANRAFFNTDLGIDAVAGTTDGGGNRANQNGDSAQCVGVVCK